MRPTVFLDLDDTLLDFRQGETNAIRHTLHVLHLPDNEAVVTQYSAINAMQWKRLERGEITRAEVLTGRFSLLFAELGVDRSCEEAWRVYEQALSQQCQWLPGAQELLRTLAPRYTLCLASNGTASVQDKRIAAAGLTPYFEKIFISQRLGVNKPDPLFFERCFAALPAGSRDRAIMVGDSLTSDILGGRRAGLHTCWFNPHHEPARTDIPADYEIHALEELPLLLEQIF